MQIKETPDVFCPGELNRALLEDVIVLADRTGVALGVQGSFSASVRSVRDDGSGLIASKCVEIPLVGRDGEISGVLRRTVPRSDTRCVFSSCAPEGAETIGDVVQFVVHDINNLLAVIGSGLRLLEQGDAAYRKAIIRKLQHAITRGALLNRQFLEDARPCPESTGGFVAGSRLAALAGTLVQAFRPDITVRTDIAPDLWDFDADPKELYLGLLYLCRSSADAMPGGGLITVAARNVEPSAGAARGFIEIVVADDGEGMPDEVLSQTFTPYVTTKGAGSGAALGLLQVQRFAEGRGGAVCVESKQGGGTLVRLFLPRVHAAELPRSIVAAEIAYTPSPDGGVFHVVNPATAGPTS